VAAYGIVSRSLTMYDSIEFTAKNLSAAIFYRPYWFLYGDVDDEKIDLDSKNIIFIIEILIFIYLFLSNNWINKQYTR
jgi:hypothetical protein